jgi:hypothetical protein
MLGRTLRDVLVVAPIVAAIPLLQVKGTIPTSACKPKRRSDVKLSRTSLFLAIAGTAAAYSQAVPPWSKGANNPAAQRGYEFHVADVDNVPDRQSQKDSLVKRACPARSAFVHAQILSGRASRIRLRIHCAKPEVNRSIKPCTRTR